VQQVFFLFACLLLLERLEKRLGAPAFAVQIVYLALICAQTGGGNLTEEYTNVFTLVGLNVILDVFEKGLPEETEGIFARAGLLGAMAALCLLVRANNALVLCAMTLVLALCLAVKRRWATLGSCAGGFLSGVVAASLPVVIWLVSRGALSEAFYGSIIHNMMYAGTGDASRVQMLLHSDYGHAAILMAALSCAGALTLLRRSFPLALAMVAGAAGAGFAAFVSHKFYQHYLVLGAPLAAMGAACVLGLSVKRKKFVGTAACAAAIAFCFAWLGLKGEETNTWRLSEREGHVQYTQQAQELYALVPPQERDLFMAYRVEPKWYVAAEALPCMRFYFLQEILADADPAVMDEIVAEFETEPPKWLVIYYNREFGPPYDERVDIIFKTRYEFVDARGQYQLLKLKETP